MNASLPKALLASFALLALAATSTQAAVIVTLPTVSTAGSIVITNDIPFTVTTAGNAYFFAFDEWVTSDGSWNYYIPGISPASFAYTLNGGAIQTRSLFGLADNYTFTAGVLTPNDGFLDLGSGFFPVSVGNVVTLKAQTWTLAANSLPSGFNPQTNQTFTGNMFLATGAGTRLSANTPVEAVPEPSRALLLLGGLGTLLFRRRR